MTNLEGISDVDICAATAAVGLLDALMDAMTAAEPGRNAARYAENLKQLGNDTATAVGELDLLLAMMRPVEQTVTAAA